MGSIINYIACPNCECEAYDDFYYKTGEEYINCNNCGYHYSSTIINRDKSLNELTEDDWEINELKDPYGAYRIKHYDSGVFSCGSLDSEGHFNGFKLQCEKDNTIECCTVSRFVDGQIKVEYVINNENKII